MQGVCGVLKVLAEEERRQRAVSSALSGPGHLQTSRLFLLTTPLTFYPVVAMNVCRNILFCNIELLSVGSWRKPPWALVRKRSNRAERRGAPAEKNSRGDLKQGSILKAKWRGRASHIDPSAS